MFFSFIKCLKNYQILFHRCGIGFDSSIPFIKFTFHSKTHFLSKIKPLSKDKRLLYRIIFKLKSQGYNFKQISKTLNKHKIKTNSGKKFYPRLVWTIYDKRMKRLKFLNQPIVEEYRDFDVVLVKVLRTI